MIKRIGLSGKMCSGKSTVANYLKENHKFIELAFADKLKQIHRDLFESKIKDRETLQLLGMKLREIDSQVWVRYVLRQIPAELNCVISDVRFLNEAQSLRGMGFVIVRLDVEPAIQSERICALYGNMKLELLHHESECALDNYDFDYVVGSTQSQEEMLHEIEMILEAMEISNNGEE